MSPQFKPAPKSPAISQFLETLTHNLYGIGRIEAIERGICCSCKQPFTDEDPDHIREFTISAVCHACFLKITEEPTDGSTPESA